MLLLLTATIWGVAFVAQSVGMEYIGPFTFNAVRSLIGGMVLIPCIALLKKIGNNKETVDNNTKKYETGNFSDKAEVEISDSFWHKNKTLLAGGISCGILLFVASSLQQFGIQQTSVGKAGFITAMYIVIVPVLGIFLKKRVGGKVWVGVAIAALGLYMLCMTDGEFSLQRGDLFVLACALVFSFHILVIDYFAAKVDGVKMACIQFFVCSLLSGIGMLLREEPDMGLIIQAWLPILYAGIMSCGMGYTLQIVGQKGMNPTVASLILSLESVVSVIAGWAILDQTLSRKELIGCTLMFAAIILVQLPEKAADKKKN